ncbi:hypothetical protein HU200_011667 [Digitaria exilis]|uniref:Core Histone H2A/H2B/H3 domain-containing protein n=1 Tax=Digitaria exilis TaxID=1010633 RepID=A0A835FHG6_9POAL|nr:hypothetical protein HU200_011667 [Digitaria exilis]
MAPKRRSSGGKVVGSVVKTKVVQETVEVTTAIVTDREPAEQPLAPVAVAPPPTVDVSSSKVVHVVEVTTPDGNTTTTAANKRSRGVRREEEKHAAPVDDSAPPVAQSQETQDPNEQPPETPRVASERKTTATKRKPQQQKAETKRKAGRRRRRRRLGEASRGGDAATGGVGGYKRYVWRVLKQVHPELGVSGNAMRVLDMFMADMFERLAGEAARLSMASGRATVGSREVQSAVRLVLPGELGRHAMSEGTKAVAKYMSYDA